MRNVIFLLGLLTFLLPATAADAVAHFPKSESIKIFVSNGTVSAWNEAGAQDYLIPGSQIYVTGLGATGEKYFGLPGALLGKLENESAAGRTGDSLKLNFTESLAKLLQVKIAARQDAKGLTLTDQPSDAQLTALPSAKLFITADKGVRLSFQMTVRFLDSETQSEVKKDYHYFHGTGRPLTGPGGWSDSDATAIKSVADEALALMAEVFLDDVLGLHAGAYEPNTRRFAQYTLNATGNAIKSLLLREYPRHLVIAPLVKGEPAPNRIFVQERRAIEIQSM